MPQRKGPKRIAFLDTNALLELFLYWETCKAASLKLDDCSDFDVLRNSLASAGSPTPFPLTGAVTDPLRRGMNLFYEITKRQSNWDFFTSQVCRSEMHHTLLEHRAVERLTASRIPHRLRAERPLVVYRGSLTDSDYSTLETQIAEFSEQLTIDHSVVIQIAEEKATDFRTVAGVAETIWSRILIDVMDAFIYASAVTSMADILITRDSPFLAAVNNVFHPPNDGWRDVRTSLDAALAAMGGGYSWPEGRSVKSPFPGRMRRP